MGAFPSPGYHPHPNLPPSKGEGTSETSSYAFCIHSVHALALYWHLLGPTLTQLCRFSKKSRSIARAAPSISHRVDSESLGAMNST